LNIISILKSTFNQKGGAIMRRAFAFLGRLGLRVVLGLLFGVDLDDE
jgi:hypothetical protein